VLIRSFTPTLTLLCGLLLASAAMPGTGAAKLRIAVLSFEDLAGFQGDWDLGRGVPELLGRELSSRKALSVVPMDSVVAAEREVGRDDPSPRELALEVGRRLQADLVVTGTVATFGVRRIVVGDPNLGGYKSYRSRIELVPVELIRVTSGQSVGNFEVVADSVNRPLELNLFGRPGAADREFRELFEVELGSEEFLELGFGQFAAACIGELGDQITAGLSARRPIDLSGERAQVLAVEGSEVYLGIGSRDFVELGDMLPLYRGDRTIARVKVTDVVGPHLSRADVVTESDSVTAGLRVGQRLPWDLEDDTD